MDVGHSEDKIVARRPDCENRKPGVVALTDCRYASARMKSARLQRLIVVALALTASVGMAATQVYSVEPQELHEGWTSQGQNTCVGQSFVANVDSLLYIDWFVAELSGPGRYRFDVVEEVENQFVCRGYESVPARGWQWVRCSTFTEGSRGLTKGVEYVLRVSHSGGDSVNYVYRTDNPYTFGAVSVSSGEAQSPPGTSNDLACRVYGRMNPVGDVWRACVNFGNEPNVDAALDSASSIGIKWLRDDLEKMQVWEDDTHPAMNIYRRYEGRYSVLGILCYGSNDSLRKSSRGNKSGNPAIYPPRNLYEDVHCDTNWWASYCKSIMGRMPKFKYWEVWPEANALWCWGDPDTFYRNANGGLIDTPRERCSLYVRMCQIAESIAQELDSGQKIVGGATYRLRDANGGITVSSGVDWLRDMFELAGLRYGGVEKCFDIVSVHPYMWGNSTPDDYFNENSFRLDLDTARAIMRAAGNPSMELWATEYGWPRWENSGTLHPPPLTDTLTQARDLSQFYTSAIARQADPRGGYDRAFWYELTGYRDNDGCIKTQGFGLLDTFLNQPRLPHSWAMHQIGDILTGKRCNGHVLDGDTAVENHARVYEFEASSGTRTWVCWKDGEAGQSIEVRLPVRTNQLTAESLAYSRTAPTFSPGVANDGWLYMSLNSRPAFISEKTAPQRPDLRVDSVRFVQASHVVVRAWVTNHGTRATPIRSGSMVPYPTLAVLRANGDSLAQRVRATSIAVDQQTEFTFNLGQTQFPDTGLFCVTVNPNQTYVELGTDDNTGYALVAKP